jgi:putative heme-binding domain-containing protein
MHWRLLRCLFVGASLAPLVLMATVARAQSPPLVAPTEALTPAEQQKLFHLPPGFEIQLFAHEPELHKPMNLSFDSAGRLFVTDTLEYPYPAAEGAVPRDSVKILVDRNLDGRADEITTFVDQLNIPLGVMPIVGGVVVYGIPAVMHCLDTDGDGKADTRDVLYANFGHRDTHGMVNSFTRGLDGWLYACHGFANDSAPQGSDGHQIKMNSGNTFRMRFDGSRVEHITHGQVNPFGMTVDPLGNHYTADCHTMPVYMLLRGAYYPSFGKAHDGLGFGPTMIKHDHGSTGIGGIAFYAAEHFPPEYRNTLFIGNPVTGRVNHDKLAQHGSTYEAIEQPDFITCDDPWFRPVNLQVGPDGALYIADFYNRIIGHYEVPLTHPGRDRERGRIWRVVYTGQGVAEPAQTAPPLAPVVAQAPPKRLFELLGDANFVQRTLATHEIVDRLGQSAVEPLKALLSSDETTAPQRVHAMWALERLGGVADELLQRLAHDDDRMVRTHVMKLLAERSWDDSPLVDAGLTDSDPFVRRAAADALARHPASRNGQPLLKLWRETDAADTHLVHVARMALRDQLLEPGVYGRLASLVGDDSDSLQRLTEVSLGVPNAESAAFVFGQLQGDSNIANREATLHHVTRHIAEERLSDVYDFVLGLQGLDLEQQAGLIRALGRGTQERGAALPDDVTQWAVRVASQLLAADHEGQVRAGIELARDFNLPLFDALARAAAADAPFDNLRPTAIDACTANDAARAVPLLATILANAAEPLNLRQHSATALARINNLDARGQLLAQLQTAPERLAIEIAAALAESPQGAEGLLAAAADGKASARLLQENHIVTRLKARNLPNLDDRLEKLTAGLPPADQRIRELIDQRRQLLAGGQADVARGAAIFEKHCGICHRIGEKGAKIGPNLDGVGIRGAERLLEDILDPSRNVDQAFRTTQIVSADGRILTGLALREEGEIVVLADVQGKEVRVPKDAIEQRVESQLSLMPSNVPDLVNEEEFVHLIGYLLSQRTGPAAPSGAATGP